MTDSLSAASRSSFSRDESARLPTDRMRIGVNPPASVGLATCHLRADDFVIACSVAVIFGGVVDHKMGELGGVFLLAAFVVLV